mgnify:CR=1 FL=1
MTAVASWEDGPEYAPLQRPSAFSAPAASPLSTPDPTPAPPTAPATPPATYEVPHEGVRPLRELVPAEGPRRNPQEPFSVVTSVMTSMETTSGSAWGSAHSTQTLSTQMPQAAPPQVAPVRAPDQAFASTYAPPPPVQGFPAPGTPAWFGPGSQFEASRVRVPPTAGNVLNSVTWGVLIPLLLGGVVPLLAPVLLVVAFLLASQVRYRRQLVRTVFYAAMGLTALAGLYGLVTDGAATAWSLMGGWAMAMSWVVIAAAIGIQYAAIHAGDRPER